MPNSTATKWSVSGLERSKINIQIKSKGSYTQHEVQFKRHTETLVMFRTCISKNIKLREHVLTWVFIDAEVSYCFQSKYFSVSIPFFKSNSLLVTVGNVYCSLELFCCFGWLGIFCF